MVLATSAYDTSGSDCEGSNLGAPPIARSSQVTWLRSLLWNTQTINRGSFHCRLKRLMVSNSAMPFICIAPSPTSAITGRSGWANLAPIA